MRTTTLCVLVAAFLAACGNGGTPPADRGEKPVTKTVEKTGPSNTTTTDEEATDAGPGDGTEEPDEPDEPGIGQTESGEPGGSDRPALAPITLELPKPLFIGTPKNLRVLKLEKPTGKPRPTFLAPAGVVNVARGKPVTGSDDEPIIGEMEFVTDGDKSGADGSYVDLAFGSQWIQIDLGAVLELYAIVVWHYHQEGRVYHDVVVQIANDADFITGVRTLFNNDDDNSSGLGVGDDPPYLETHEGRLIAVKGRKARYVRLYSRGNTSNDQNHYVEVEVYGKPSP